jgi:putative oxidoreductase
MDHLGKLALRLSVGGLMLFHGIHKLLNGFDMIGDMLVKNNLPREMMWGVPVGEVAAPVLMILGLWTRPAALVAFTMAMSVYLVFRDQLWTLNEYGAVAYELNLLYFFGAISVMLLGAGKFSVTGGQGKLN